MYKFTAMFEFKAQLTTLTTDYCLSEVPINPQAYYKQPWATCESMPPQTSHRYTIVHVYTTCILTHDNRIIITTLGTPTHPVFSPAVALTRPFR